jgi:ABC-type antimicrobial peptide transport system ATPase subunit
VVAHQERNQAKKGVSNMPIDRVFVNFEETFGKGIFLGVEPKMTKVNKNDPKSPLEQAHDANGLLRWTATIAVKLQAFETAKMENIAVTINSPQKPYERIAIGALYQCAF